MNVGKKYRGSFAKALVQYIHDRLRDVDDLCPGCLFISHSGVSDEILTLVRETALECVPFQRVCITPVGCTISSHCGPGTLGLLFVHKTPIKV